MVKGDGELWVEQTQQNIETNAPIGEWIWLKSNGETLTKMVCENQVGLLD